MHDPAIGRFGAVDPLSEKYVHNSTYAFSENMLIRHIELEGLESMAYEEKMAHDSDDKWYHTAGKFAYNSFVSFGNGIASMVNFAASPDSGIKSLKKGLSFAYSSISTDIKDPAAMWQRGRENISDIGRWEDFTGGLAMLYMGGRSFGKPSSTPSLTRVAAQGAGLSDDVANTFQFGRYTEITLDKPMVLSRYYDNVNAFAKGRFMTNSTSKFTFLDRVGMAIRPEWNAMTKVANWEVQAGSTIYVGKTAMQFPWLGGKTQYFVPDLSTIKRVIK